MAEFRPTALEARFVGYASVVLGAGSIVGLIVGNTTGNWIPEFGISGAYVVCLVGMIIWAARTRNQGWMETARQALRRKPGRRS